MAKVHASQYAYGHKAKPVRVVYPGVTPVGSPGVWRCGDCGLPITFIKQTSQPDQWRHQRRKKAK